VNLRGEPSGPTSHSAAASSDLSPFLAGSVARFYLFVALVQFLLWLPIWVIFFQGRGLSLTQIGVLDAVGWIFMALSEVPTGALADRYGRKISLVGGALLITVSMFAILTDIFSPVFLVGWMLWGVAHTFFSGADAAFLYDTLKERGLASDYPRFAGWHLAVVQGSQGLGSLLGGWVATRDMTLCFVIPGVLGLAAAAVAASLREPGRSDWLSTNPGYWTAICEAVATTSTRPVVRYLVLIGASTLVLPFLLVFMLLQPYVTGLGLPVWSLGVIVLLRGAGAVVGSLLAARTARAFGASRVLNGTQVITVLCMILLAAAPLPPIVGLFAVISFASGMARPVLSTLLNAEIPSEQRATILSLQALLWTLFLAGVEPLLFALAEGIGMPLTIGAAGIVLAILAAVLIGLWRQAVVQRSQAFGLA
jgi:MFS family permease